MLPNFMTRDPGQLIDGENLDALGHLIVLIDLMPGFLYCECYKALSKRTWRSLSGCCAGTHAGATVTPYAT
jgi:hypothetical protein